MKVQVLLLALAAGAAAVPTSLVVHEKIDIENSQWNRSNSLDSSMRIPVRIALKQRNLEHGMEYLMKV